MNTKLVKLIIPADTMNSACFHYFYDTMYRRRNCRWWGTDVDLELKKHIYSIEVSDDYDILIRDFVIDAWMEACLAAQEYGFVGKDIPIIPVSTSYRKVIGRKRRGSNRVTGIVEIHLSSKPRRTCK